MTHSDDLMNAARLAKDRHKYAKSARALVFSKGDGAANHNYLPEIQASHAQHGSDTVISFGLGVAPDAGTVLVSDLGPNDPMQLHLVLRPA
ncbi:hypothetical protein KMP13_02395 [Epibacterium ulvae]|uniref:hypothetical protein n=1 Tax=Epibacterium ulvae TaxID=1156985 RepID=UPI001BFC2771|nr:hypothetical protein [Epibacterium ulvae]MBT8152764.1 hypothetical protein [Epibacterium ulvae]